MLWPIAARGNWQTSRCMTYTRDVMRSPGLLGGDFLCTDSQAGAAPAFWTEGCGLEPCGGACAARLALADPNTFSKSVLESRALTMQAAGCARGGVDSHSRASRAHALHQSNAAQLHERVLNICGAGGHEGSTPPMATAARPR